MALLRDTTQSDVLWSYGPDLAVDGDPNTCSFTSRKGEQRWWQVSFKAITNKKKKRTVATLGPANFDDGVDIVLVLLTSLSFAMSLRF